MPKSPSCFSPLSAIDGVGQFNFCHSRICVVISRGGFNLPFPGDLRWTSFHMLIYHLNIFFSEVSVQIFWSFFNWVVCLPVSCKSSVYILAISWICVFANIFFQGHGLPFHFCNSIFWRTSLLNVGEVQFLVLFSCIICAFLMSCLRNLCQT